jgi:hypothetical protein
MREQTKDRYGTYRGYEVVGSGSISHFLRYALMTRTNQQPVQLAITTTTGLIVRTKASIPRPARSRDLLSSTP